MKSSKLQRGKQMARFMLEGPDHAQSCFALIHCMNYVTETFLLVSCLYFVRFVHGQGQKSEQKVITKNFAGLNKHFALLTMITLCTFLAHI